MNDRQRWEFAGRPERCIKCGATLCTSDVATSAPGIRRCRAWCPNYGKAVSSSLLPFSLGIYSGSGEGHEWYSWFTDDPGLPPFLQPLTVGPAGPYERAAIYATVVLVILVGVTALVASLFGG